MDKGFMKFINQKENTVLEAAALGISSSHLKLPLDFPALGFFLSYVEGSQAVKAEALNWIFSEGLAEASLNREKLLQMVNNINTIQLNPKLNNPQANPYKMAEMAFNPEDIEGPEIGDKSITALDLFSPQSWKIKGIDAINERFKNKYGQGILEYYRDNLEPKIMIIDMQDKKGKRYGFDLDRIREAAKKAGFPPFYYGGFDGYMHYVEGGSWLPPVQRRAMLGGHLGGVSLEPVKTLNKETNKPEVNQDLFLQITNNGKKFNFQGGAFIPSEKQALLSLHHMNFYFVKAALKDPRITEEDKRRIESISSAISQMKSEEKTLQDIKGKEKMAQKLGFPIHGGGEEKKNFYDLPTDINTFKEFVKKGLSMPIFDISYDSFKNLYGFGNELESLSQASKSEDGWWAYDPYRKRKNEQRVIIKFNKQQQNDIFNIIFLPENKGKYIGIFRYNSGLANKFPSLKVLEAKKNTKFNLTTILNNVLENDRNLQKTLKRTVFQIPEQESTKYAQFLGEIKKELQVPFDPRNEKQDPILESLFDKGFKWELSSQAKQQNWPHPFVDYFTGKSLKTPIGWLKNPAGIRIRLEKIKDKWFVFIPSKKAYGQGTLRTHGAPERSPLMARAGEVFPSAYGGHISAFAVSKKTWAVIEKELLKGCQGNLGECEFKQKEAGTYVSTRQTGSDQQQYKTILDIPSVVGGVGMAKTWFNKNHSKGDKLGWFQRNMMTVLGGNPNMESRPADYFAETDLKTWAVEALRLHANDPAFQVGWTTQEEWDEFSAGKINLNAEIGKSYIKDLSGVGKTGMGLKAILYNNEILGSKGIVGNDDIDDNDDWFLYLQEKIKNAIEDSRKANSMDNLFLLPKVSKIADDIKQQAIKDGLDKVQAMAVSNNIYKSIATNALMFRKKTVADYVIDKMEEALRKAAKNSAESMPTTKDETGDERAVDFAGDKRLGQRGEYEADIDHVKDISALHGLLGISDADVIADPKLDDKAVRGGGQQISAPSDLGLAKQIIAKKAEPILTSKALTPEQKKDALSRMMQKYGQSTQQPLVAAKPTPTQPAQPPMATKPTPAQLAQPPMSAKPQQPSVATKPTPPQPAQPPMAAKPKTKEEILAAMLQKYGKTNESLASYQIWKAQNFFKEMAGTSAVYDKTKRKPKDGSGFNWWGAPGNLGGTSIAGEADTAESDPTGKKGTKNVRKR